MKSKTQDEKFLIALYQAAKETDDLETPFNRYTIGQSVGLHERGVNAICKLLLQANFIKKSSEEEIYITEHGASLVIRLMDEI